MYQNRSLILKFHFLIPGPTNKIGTENRQSKSVYCNNYAGRKLFHFLSISIYIKVCVYSCVYDASWADCEDMYAGNNCGELQLCRQGIISFPVNQYIYQSVCVCVCVQYFLGGLRGYVYRKELRGIAKCIQGIVSCCEELQLCAIQCIHNREELQTCCEELRVVRNCNYV